MTTLDDFSDDLWPPPEPVDKPPVKCRRHDWTDRTIPTSCSRCGKPRDDARARMGRNNRKRGGDAELSVARETGGRKVGPLGQPWDVEMPGYARLQVKKVAAPPSLRFVARELARIGSTAEMPGFVWVQPGRGGERLIVFRLADFAERHGIPEVDVA